MLRSGNIWERRTSACRRESSTTYSIAQETHCSMDVTNLRKMPDCPIPGTTRDACMAGTPEARHGNSAIGEGGRSGNSERTSYDGSSPKPYGRKDSDICGMSPRPDIYCAKGTEEHHVKKWAVGRECITMGTWNVRTFHRTGQLALLEHELKEYRWNVIGLSETRWTGNGEWRTGNGNVLYYAGEENRHERGVGFLVHKDTVKHVIEYEAINSRLIRICLAAKPINISIIQIYAPTTDAQEEEMDEFYGQLQRVIDIVAGRDILIVMGDCNAKIGVDQEGLWRDCRSRSGLGERNERGERLLQFCRDNALFIANTLGTHKNSRRCTWISNDGQTRNQIDYIMVNRRWKSGIKFARAFPGADVGSDHNLVLMNFIARLKKMTRNQITAERKRFDVSKLKDDKIREKYQNIIRNKFEPLMSLENPDPQELMEEVADILKDATMETCGLEENRRHPWTPTEVLQLSEERRKLKGQRKDDKKRAKYNRLSKEIKSKMKESKEEWINKKCEEIESDKHKNMGRMYRTVRELTQEFKACSSNIRDKDGKLATGKQEKMEAWMEYCKELYNKDMDNLELESELREQRNEMDEEIPGITREEVKFAIESLANGKSPGADNISAEMIKQGGESAVDMMWKVCKEVWEKQVIPKEWTQSIIVPIPKSGDLTQCTNYRTISLISHASKVFWKVVLERLKPRMEEVLAEEQAGFRKNRSTIEQIFVLRLLAEKAIDHSRDIYHTFVDFKKAFDSVWQEALWAIMKFYGFSIQMIEIICKLYSQTENAVRINGDLTEWFRVTMGVRQGCMLSPLLFNVFLEYIMAQVLEDSEIGISIGGRLINNLRFADDIDLIATSEQKLQELTKKVQSTAAKFGMEVNTNKTKCMVTAKDSKKTTIMLDGQLLESVDHFKYLGSIMTSDARSEKDILARLGKASGVAAKLAKVLKQKQIKCETKKRLLWAVVFSVATYGCEAWTVTKAMEKRINAFEMKIYRRMLCISYMDRISNKEVLERINVKEEGRLLHWIQCKKATYFGHVCRMKGDRLPKMVMEGTLEGARIRGRPRKQWWENIVDWTGRNYEQCRHLAMERATWREICKNTRTANVPRRSKD